MTQDASAFRNIVQQDVDQRPWIIGRSFVSAEIGQPSI